jgi:predicted MFS family arabinose efflux permease
MVFSALAFMPLHLQTYHGISVSASGAMVTLYGVGGLIYSRTARQLLRRLGEPGLARLGGAIMLIGLAMALAPHWPWALPACALFGLGFYCLHGTLQANATQISEHQRAIAVSLYASLLFLGQSFGVALGAELVNAADGGLRGWTRRARLGVCTQLAAACRTVSHSRLKSAMGLPVQAHPQRPGLCGPVPFRLPNT